MIHLSIIVPIYKTEKYIDACIQSILQQTYQDFELILVNDGSPDNCGKICDDYAKKDSRIKVIHKENGGQSSARNAGLDIAQGSIIGFVDSDDTIDSDMYEKMISFLEGNDLDIVCCDAYLERNYKTKIRLRYPSNKIFSGLDCVCENLKGGIDNSVPNKIYKREIFNNIRFKENIVFEDVAIMHLLCYKAQKIGYISQALYHYFKRENSTIANSFNCQSRYNHFCAYRDRLSFAIEKNIPCLNECRVHAMETALAALTSFYALNENFKSDIYLEVNYFIEQNLDSDICRLMRTKNKFLLWSFKNCKILYRMYAKLSEISKKI